MFKYAFDEDTRGILLKPIENQDASWRVLPHELRPVYAQELNFYHFDKWWTYDQDFAEPILWGDMNRLVLNGEVVAKVHYAVQTDATAQIEVYRKDLKLEPIDVEGMLAKNRAMLDELYGSTTNRLYKSICEVQEHTGNFFLSFSGGKDSCALFYAVENLREAYPYLLTKDNFAIGFSDTDMEKPDTYKTIEKFQALFEERGIKFVRARAEKSAAENWMYFGPPSRLKRWCCTVHKTTPLVLAYRDLLRERGVIDETHCALVGVRAAESARRRSYEVVMQSKKSKGDWAIYPILDWSSAEVWLCMYDKDAYVNEAYKRGSKRVGCLLCPIADDSSSDRDRGVYNASYEPYDNAIDAWYRLQQSAKPGWRIRRNALYNLDIESEAVIDTQDDLCTLTLGEFRQDYRELLKSINAQETSPGEFYVEALGQRIGFTVDGNVVRIQRNHKRKGNKVVSWIKKIFIRSVYCVACRTCETFCPKEAIVFREGKIKILPNCVHCGTCYEKKDVCIAYECRKVPPRRKELLKRAEERATRAREEHERQERNKQPLLRLLGESDQG